MNLIMDLIMNLVMNLTINLLKIKTVCKEIITIKGKDKKIMHMKKQKITLK